MRALRDWLIVFCCSTYRQYSCHVTIRVFGESHIKRRICVEAKGTLLQNVHACRSYIGQLLLSKMYIFFHIKVYPLSALYKTCGHPIWTIEYQLEKENICNTLCTLLKKRRRKRKEKKNSWRERQVKYFLNFRCSYITLKTIIQT